MPTTVPRKPYERLLIRTKWLLSSSVSSCEASCINPKVRVKLSPSKATRAAMLRARFADTILKAKQKKLFEYVPNTILVKTRKPKDVAAAALEIEKAKNIARQKLRVKARHDLEKMEATVCVEDNVKIMEELWKLAYCNSPSDPFNGDYSLEKLGLRLKDSDSSYDDIEDSIFLNEEIEEGEIVD